MLFMMFAKGPVKSGFISPRKASVRWSGGTMPREGMAKELATLPQPVRWPNSYPQLPAGADQSSRKMTCLYGAALFFGYLIACVLRTNTGLRNIM